MLWLLVKVYGWAETRLRIELNPTASTQRFAHKVAISSDVLSPPLQ